MTNPEVQFVCPKCQETCLVEERGDVRVKTAVVGFFVNENPATHSGDSPRYTIEEGECGRSDGKVIAYHCAACGFTPMTQKRTTGYWPNRAATKPKPIISKFALHQWLKRNKMLRERALV